MKIQLEDIQTHYRILGPTEGLPLVLIHPYPFHSKVWDSQMEVLPPWIRGITYDVRGLGDSTLGTSPFTLDQLVKDLINLLDHLEITGAVLCGLSMGGYIALRAIQSFPDRVRGLVLCNTRSEADSNQDKINRDNALTTLREEGIHRFAKVSVTKLLAPKTMERKPDLQQELIEIIEGNSPLAIANVTLALISRLDTTAALAKIQAPTLVLHGEADPLIPAKAALEMSKKIPDSQTALLPSAGHLSNVEDPKGFNRALFAFLKTLL